MSDDITPFRVEVAQADIDDLRDRLARTRWPDQIPGSGWSYDTDLDYLRDRLHAPIVWDAQRGGYRYDAPPARGPRFQLPGVWFNASEVHALLAMQHLIANLEPGLLSAQVGPLRERLRELLGSGDHSADEIENRVKILHMASRRGELRHFETICSALLRRQQIGRAHV